MKKVMLLAMLFIGVSMAYPQVNEEPIEYTRDAYIEQINLLEDMLAECQNKGDSFCDGWEDGYIQGWCYQQPNCYEPYVPLCPLPDWNEDHYKGGYNRGFLAGREARE